MSLRSTNQHSSSPPSAAAPILVPPSSSTSVGSFSPPTTDPALTTQNSPQLSSNSCPELSSLFLASVSQIGKLETAAYRRKQLVTLLQPIIAAYGGKRIFVSDIRQSSLRDLFDAQLNSDLERSAKKTKLEGALAYKKQLEQHSISIAPLLIDGLNISASQYDQQRQLKMMAISSSSSSVSSESATQSRPQSRSIPMMPVTERDRLFQALKYQIHASGGLGVVVSTPGEMSRISRAVRNEVQSRVGTSTLWRRSDISSVLKTFYIESRLCEVAKYSQSIQRVVVDLGGFSVVELQKQWPSLPDRLGMTPDPDSSFLCRILFRQQNSVPDELDKRSTSNQAARRYLKERREKMEP